MAEHNDHLTVARILLNSATSKLDLGLTVPSLPVIDNNFTGSKSYSLKLHLFFVVALHSNIVTLFVFVFLESQQEFDSYLYYMNPACCVITPVTIGSNAIYTIQQQQSTTNNNQMPYHTVNQQLIMVTNINTAQQQQQQQQTQHQSIQHQHSQQPASQLSNTSLQQLQPPSSSSQHQQTQQQQQQQQLSLQSTTTSVVVVTASTTSGQNVGNTIQINPNTSENSEVPLIIADENAPPQPGPTMPIAHVIKSLLKFLAHDTCQPLWNYEDITAKGKNVIMQLVQIFTQLVLTCWLLKQGKHSSKLTSFSLPRMNEY